MSEVQVRIGYAREIKEPFEPHSTVDFKTRCVWIRQFIFFHDWQYIYPENKHVEWETDENQILFMDNKFYLLTFLVNNSDLYGSVLIPLEKHEREEFFFSFIYYDGGTWFGELFAEQIEKMENKDGV